MSQDREFETYIEGKSELSHLYRDVSQAEPPEHLDAAILAQAHRAVGARPGAPRKRRWVMPLSMVASVFVAVMIGLQLPELLKEPAVRQMATQDRVDVPVPDRAAAAKPAPQERKPAPAPITPAETSAAPAPAVPRGAVPVQRFAPEMKAEAKVAPAAAASVAAPVVPEKPVAAREGAGERPAFESESTRVAKRKKSDVRMEDTAGERFAPAAPAAAPAPMAEAISEPVQAAPVPQAVGAASVSPEDWLTRIKRLKQEGRLDDAARELAGFRKRYPDYPVPRELQGR